MKEGGKGLCVNFAPWKKFRRLLRWYGNGTKKGLREIAKPSDVDGRRESSNRRREGGGAFSMCLDEGGRGQDEHAQVVRKRMALPTNGSEGRSSIRGLMEKKA